MDGDGNAVVDYIRADMIDPIAWDNGDSTECAFGSNRVSDGKEIIYLQIHRKGRAAATEDEDAVPENPDT